jgi:hypothetical protein
MVVMMWVCVWSTVAQAQQETTIRTGEDTWLDAANPHQKHGTEATLQVGGPKTARRALLRFQVSEIDSRWKIQSASIQLKLAKPAAQWRDQSVQLLLVSDPNKGWGAVSDVENSFVHLWDPDGLWVGRLLESPVLNGVPSWVFQIKCENFGGSIHTEKDGNVLFFASNENNVNVFRIRGWDKFQRQQGSLTLNTRP